MSVEVKTAQTADLENRWTSTLVVMGSVPRLSGYVICDKNE